MLGRVLKVAFRFPFAEFINFNAQIQDLAVGVVRFIVRGFHAASACAAQAPDRVMVLVLGDFNYAAEGALVHDSPVAAVRQSERRHHGEAPIWRQALGTRLEFERSTATHFDKRANTEAAIDGVYSSLASCQACQLYSLASTLETLATANVVSTSPRSARPADQRRAPKRIVRTPCSKSC